MLNYLVQPEWFLAPFHWLIMSVKSDNSAKHKCARKPQWLISVHNEVNTQAVWGADNKNPNILWLTESRNVMVSVYESH